MTICKFPISQFEIKVTRPSYFVGQHPTLNLSGIHSFTLILSLTYSMDNVQINLQHSIKFLAMVVNITWLQCHASLGPESRFCCCRHFFVKISRLHIVRIRALCSTEFHQNRKDPMREIQRFANLGHNLCKSMDEVKFVYKWHLKHSSKHRG